MKIKFSIYGFFSQEISLDSLQTDFFFFFLQGKGYEFAWYSVKNLSIAHKIPSPGESPFYSPIATSVICFPQIQLACLYSESEHSLDWSRNIYCEEWFVNGQTDLSVH